ncbi:FAD/NAD(P)-binding protein (plasmid) [Streptomyces sp. NBC_01591]|uniref:FAD/NAD(P)-binding protein n=1 Tax=Streptomyces sp. NBC_01591 TaxID=2975888 RepID=UPI002DDB0C7F|nr:FAD/NAD(P)-binding protein [Streptomyces sp. NBC_01591]WSD73898.1 FAD/NAD(P)-binding protein [Streptomyces sp. NBC_01591]
MNTPQAPSQGPYTIAVVGTGPRGISVLERLAVRLREAAEHDPRPVTIYAVDAVEVGAGRIWRTDQDPWFAMNTVIGQVTMFSGAPDGGRPRPGAGPSLGQWLHEYAPERARPGDGHDPHDFASRLEYGRYLRFVYRAVTDELPPHVRLIPVLGRVTSVRPGQDGRYRVAVGEQRTFEADKVVLTTGHPDNDPDDFDRAMSGFAEGRTGVHYLSGNSAADMDLAEKILPGTTVAVRGMGLSFYDVLMSLTEGRGGRFVRDEDGHLGYEPSGNEPVIVAGSRSGLPIPARGRSQKAPNYVHRGTFLTDDAVARARERRRQAGGSGQLDFEEDLLGQVLQEIRHVYYTGHMRTRHGAEAAEKFAARYATEVHAGGDGTVAVAEADLLDVPELDLRRLARPFDGEHFADAREWRCRLTAVLRQDLREAALGTVDGPLKAALDTLRDLRGVLRSAVDYGGLLPGSYDADFRRGYVPVNALLSAGPPMVRTEQLMALMDRGIVEVMGPRAVFGTDEETGTFTVHSPHVEGSRRSAEVLVDARIPVPDLRRDRSPLMRQLLSEGLVGEFVNRDPATGEEFATGGLDVERGSFRVVGADGTARSGLYALGIPTEHVRWFTQIGNGRPGLNTEFRKVADVVAAELLPTSVRGDAYAHERVATHA